MKRGEAGVTRVGILIPLTLVAALSCGLLYAMRVGLSAMDRSQARLISNRRVVSVERILEQQIAGLMPVKALCAGEGGPPAKVSFFQGGTSTMRFASSYSLHEGPRGYP